MANRLDNLLQLVPGARDDDGFLRKHRLAHIIALSRLALQNAPHRDRALYQIVNFNLHSRVCYPLDGRVDRHHTGLQFNLICSFGGDVGQIRHDADVIRRNIFVVLLARGNRNVHSLLQIPLIYRQPARRQRIHARIGNADVFHLQRADGVFRGDDICPERRRKKQGD